MKLHITDPLLKIHLIEIDIPHDSGMAKRPRVLFLPFQLLWGAMRAKADLSAVTQEETCGSQVLSAILRKPEDSVREWFRPPGREPARRCVPLSSQTIGRVMASLRPFLFSLIRPPASEEPATTTISSIYQPHILERGAIGERVWERENKRKSEWNRMKRKSGRRQEQRQWCKKG